MSHLSKLILTSIGMVCLLSNIVLSQWSFTKLTENKINEYDAVIASDETPGVVHIVYRSLVGTGSSSCFKLFYIKKEGNVFSEPVRITNIPLGQCEQHPAIDVDNQGVHVVFELEVAQNIYGVYYTLFTGLQNSPLKVFESTFSLSNCSPDIALDGNGVAHISFVGFDGTRSDVYYSHNVTGTFLIQPINVTGSLEPVGGNSGSRIKVNSTGIAHIAYIDSFDTDQSGGDYDDADVSYTHNQTPYAADFIQPVRANPEEPGTQYAHPSLAIDDLYAHIGYSRYENINGPLTGRIDCYYVRLNRENPVRPSLIDLKQISFVTDQNEACNIGLSNIEGSSLIHIVWSGGFQAQGLNSTELYHASITPQGEVSTSEQITNNNVMNGQNSLAVESGGTIHISYVQKDVAKQPSAEDYEIWYATNYSSPAGKMHISSVKVITQLKGKSVNGIATINVVDEYGNPVEGASVSGVWSGLTTDSDVFLTGSDGSGSCNSDKVNKTMSGYFIFTVTDVSKDGWVYDPASNVEDQDSAPWNVSPKVSPGENTTILLSTTELLGNYPNPFNPVTTIRYRLADNQSVKLEIYNLQGQLIRTLVDGEQEAGEYSVLWNANNHFGQKVASGIYLYRLCTSNNVFTNKMFLMK